MRFRRTYLAKIKGAELGLSCFARPYIGSAKISKRLYPLLSASRPVVTAQHIDKPRGAIGALLTAKTAPKFEPQYKLLSSPIPRTARSLAIGRLSDSCVRELLRKQPGLRTPTGSQIFTTLRMGCARPDSSKACIFDCYQQGE